MADQADASKRVERQTKLFSAVIHGHRDLKSTADGNRFLEALCAQQDVSKCVERVMAAPGGLSAIACAFRFSRDSAFLNGPAASVLHYLSDPSLQRLYSGQFLHRVLEQIVQPPTFWNTLVEAHHARILTEHGTRAFAWLLLELLCSRSEETPDVRHVAERISKDESLTSATSLAIREYGHKIKHVLDSTSSDATDGPGGRHDNDCIDFRKIKILPTMDEFASTKRPFYRRADAVESIEPEDRGLPWLDNQFRLLREDLLGELRNDFQTATGQKKGRRKCVLTGLQFIGIDCGSEMKRKPCCIKFQCMDDIPQMRHLKGIPLRKKFIIDSRNRSILKHQSLGCLISDSTVVAFASVERDENLLAREPPIVVLRIADEGSFNKVVLASKFTLGLQFVQVDTAVFAYEPILKRLQSMTEISLQEQLLALRPGSNEAHSGIEPTNIINLIQNNRNSDLQDILRTSRSVELDATQAQSLLTGLSKRVSLIQGPPGTGKSFIGALIAKTLHDHTKETILVLTYTNHALDQFLVDLQIIGIPADSIVRLGQKFNDSTRALSIGQQPNSYKMSGLTYHMIQDQKSEAEAYHDTLIKKVSQFSSIRITEQDLLDYLEYSEDSEYFDAFNVSDPNDGMTRVGKKGKRIDKFYLLNQWTAGKDAGILKRKAEKEYSQVWKIDPQFRISLREKWLKGILEEVVSEINNLVRKYNQCRDRVEQLYREKHTHIIGRKRIIGCTTTAAAKYTEELQKASPGIILVEEAGEILESHILTALTPDTKQLVLIGDHKQLRPKVNNYLLTVEKGDGYNLNQSLFERLVLAGVPHTTLNKQHRMRPEISSLVRSLTYPELEDATKTKGRPALRGFQDNVIFVSHNRPELNADRIADRRDEGSKSSKENEYESDMVLRCVRYLGQQGYGTDQIVVLTPYLGQLYLLLRTLSNENDPILNDLDSFELIRAGLLSPAGAIISKRKIRISTIDNYQGEESDIVIACLTRSNTVGDIGFMSSPQRVNVLLSRARNALIMIGNADTFMNSRKGKEVWIPLMDQLKRQGHVYDGFPVKCEQHPDKTAFLDTKEQFDSVCPDGGCSELCGITLNCGIHGCPHRCHQLQDHSKMMCVAIVTFTCPKNHKLSRKCHDKAATTCPKCETETRAKERKLQRDHKLDQERQAKQNAYAVKLAEVEDEIEHQRRILKEQIDENDRRDALAQKKQDLANLKEKTRNLHKAPYAVSTKIYQLSIPVEDAKGKIQTYTAADKTSTNPTPSQGSSDAKASDGNTTSESDTQPEWNQSVSKDDWEWQKKFEGADNEALDLLMSMVGLESVKQQFLSIKAKVDTIVRQNVSLNGERFSAALLGNPGTGKTTVARLYAKFLMKVGVLPGDHFIETSGSSLANDGVSACKKHVDKVLEEGGGVFFIDEAYQLVSGNSPGGKAVLDYLLPEIENLTGKIVFVLAGYHKQMEAFFAHNSGIPSRIPIQMEFQDYSDRELQQIFYRYVNAKYKGAMGIEGGMGGLYVRILCRRIGSGRGRDSFGNAREVQNKISQVTERQAKRLHRERRTGLKPDDNFLTKEDVIGPEPSSVLENNTAWTKLRRLIGLQSVKESVQTLLDGIQFNYQRELDEKPLVQYSLNRCFIGSPGTGKTSVAKLYGRILADIGLLSNGEVVTKNPSDFVGNVLGQSESNTKAILASTIGKVLIIDEAYMLAGSSVADPYKSAVIDTIVAEVQSTPGEDRCVLLLGYKDQMEEMFRDVNPGLARRFPLESAFDFEDFTDAELRQILDLKLQSIGFDATDQAKRVAMDVLQRARNKSNFGNAGEVDIILDRAKSLHQKHMSAGRSKHIDALEAIDFDPDFDRGERAATNLPQLFQDVVGCDHLIKQFQGYQTSAANMKLLGMDPKEQIPFNFLFKGPPGTGKTTTARKIGKVFYDMGFLSQAKVEEVSATDMIGQYVGQTGPKVQKLLEKSLGKVLFIDEAYRLAEGGFATEAMDELVDCLTKQKFAQKLVTILAGYDKDMDRLMGINPGLTSRFPESVTFSHMEPDTCLELLIKVLGDLKKKEGAPLDLTVLTPPSIDLRHRILELFQSLSSLDSWGNARDVKFLAKSMFRKLIANSVPPMTNLVITEDTVIETMKEMYDERSHRNEAARTTRFPSHQSLFPIHQSQQQNASNPNTSKASTKLAASPLLENEARQGQSPHEPVKQVATIDENDLDSIFRAKRDPGVSDAVWEQLERDKRALVVYETEYRRQQEEKRQEEQRVEKLKRAEQAANDDEEKRRHEAERIQAELEQRRNEEIRAAQEKEREKERKAQKKAQELGRCPVGYRWIRQKGGYRCAGGSHFLSDAQVG